jgi:hypothetical protein
VTPALPYAYVVVVSRDGPLADPLLDGITDRSLGHVPFAATASVRWRSSDVRVAVIVFDGIDVLESGVPWGATSGVLAFAGFPVPRAGGHRARAGPPTCATDCTDGRWPISPPSTSASSR